MTLTKQGECASQCDFDLGAGYPQIQLPLEIADAILDSLQGRIKRLSPAFDASSAKNTEEIWERFLDSLALLLGVRVDSLECFPTYTGSAAISRALAASQRLTVERNLSRTVLWLLSPSIDVYRLFSDELRNFETRHISCHLDSLRPDMEKILMYADCPSDEGAQTVFLIASPENPTGYVWKSENLQTLVSTCKKHGHCLIVDHSFAVAGVQDKRISMIWDMDCHNAHIIGLWDTGKTFGLNGEKIAIASCTNNMAKHLAESMLVLQLETSLDQIATFSMIIRAAATSGYLQLLAQICRRNLNILREEMSVIGVHVHEPDGGSFALVDLRKMNLDAKEVRERILENGVGVVDASVLFRGEINMGNIIRVSLARDHQIFSQAVAKIKLTISAMTRQRSTSRKSREVVELD